MARHFERFLLTISANIEQMVLRLESNSMLDDVELWSLALSPEEQMDVVRAAGTTPKEKLDFMATYYSLQFLHMNFLALDRLDLALSGGDRNAAFREFIESQGANFHKLNAAYIGRLLDSFVEGTEHPEYCVCNVGTLSDQDDVDIAVIQAGPEGTATLSHAVGRVVTEFFRRSGRLHLYVAERMGIQYRSNSATVEEYASNLPRIMTDFVMLCEMLSAEYMVGSRELFVQFQRQVTDRFYGGASRWRKYHEGFLRGLLGEMHSLLVHDVSRDRIHFKNDSVRLAKGMALAGKVANDIRAVQPLAVLDELPAALPKLAEDVTDLKDALVFVEVFRLLYHMFGVQEEEVEISQQNEPALETVAAAMGYEEGGGVSASSHLLVNYFEAVERIRAVSKKLMVRLADYVKTTSGYSYLAANGPRRKRNVASELADSVRVFSGHIFFEDVLSALKEKGGELASTLVEHTLRLPPRRREGVVDSLLEFAESDPHTMLDLLLTIRDVGSQPALQMYGSILEKFFARIDSGGEFLPGLVTVFTSDAALMNRFVEALTPLQRQRFEGLLAKDLRDEEQQEALRRLRKYIWLRTAGSEYYRRVFRRVIKRYPHFIRHLGDAERLRRHAAGFMAHPENGQDEARTSAALADNHDAAWLACAIEAINGAPLATYRANFIQFMDEYMGILYAFSKKSVVRQSGLKIVPKGYFAMFASGGFARGQAFDDDYDLVLVANTGDREILDFYGRVAAAMHGHIVRRGTLPQYRFSDHFGGFVASFEELRDWFASGRADTIDKTQILGARKLVGSSQLQTLLHREIVEPFIFDRFEQFRDEMVAEMDARHAGVASPDFESLVRIKEGPGGLRDIEQVLLLLKARCRVHEPDFQELFRVLAVAIPSAASLLDDLQEHHGFLRQVRDLYRLGVAADDDMCEDELGLVARIMQIPPATGQTASRTLADHVRKRMSRVATDSRKLIGTLPKPEGSSRQ